jgi:hypothetical protein
MDSQNNKPFSVTILTWMVLSLAGWNAVRLGAAIAQWKTLKEIAPQPGPLYIAVSGGVWFIVGMVLLWGRVRRKAWTGKAILLAAAGYGSWYWIDRLWLQAPRANWPFALGVTAVLLIIVALAVLNRFTASYFSQREDHER